MLVCLLRQLDFSWLVKGIQSIYKGKLKSSYDDVTYAVDDFFTYVKV